MYVRFASLKEKRKKVKEKHIGEAKLHVGLYAKKRKEEERKSKLKDQKESI